MSCQRFMVGPGVLDDLEEREQMQAAIVSGRQEKKLMEFHSLKTKVDAIKALKKSQNDMNVSQLKLMATWYKVAGDLPVPMTRTALLERIHATIGREEPREPLIHNLVHQVPSPVATAAAAAIFQDELAE